MTRAPEPQHAVSDDRLPRQRPHVDPAEARRESLDRVVDHAGPRRGRQLTLRMWQRARLCRVGVPGLRSTGHVNTIPPAPEPTFPGDEQVDRRIQARIRRNPSREENDLARRGGGHHR